MLPMPKVKVYTKGGRGLSMGFDGNSVEAVVKNMLGVKNALHVFKL